MTGGRIHHVPVPSLFIDSGDNFGSIPSSLLGTTQTSGPVPVGTVISVYDGSQLLYTYTTTSTDALTVTGTVMNTGNVPFELGPVYISESPSSLGTTIFELLTYRPVNATPSMTAPRRQ